MAARNNDPQMTDFVESEFLSEQVKASVLDQNHVKNNVNLRSELVA